MLDAGLVVYDKNVDGDKYTRYVPTATAETVCRIGAFEESTWALILCNLVYTPAYNWFVNNLKQGVAYTKDSIILMLSDVMENDLKGLGKRNVVDAFKIVMAKTPLGTSHIFAECDEMCIRDRSGLFQKRIVLYS